MVGLLQDSVDHRVTQIQVWSGHVYLSAQCMLALPKITRPHTSEKAEVLFNGAIPVGAFFTRLDQAAPVVADFIRAQITDEILARLDQFNRILI